MKKNNNLSGIYCIENIINLKKYIGYSNDINKRWNSHKNELRKNIHKNDYLQNSYNKYGKSNFEYYIIQILDPIEAIMKLMEIYWIEYHKSFYLEGGGYNMTRGGEGTCGYKQTEEQRKKILEGFTDEVREKSSLLNQGQKKRKNKTASKYVGVGLQKSTGKWISSIRKSNKLIHLGLFLNEQNAAFCYNLKAKEIYGENATLNIVDENIGLDSMKKDLEEQLTLKRIHNKKSNATSKFYGVHFDNERKKYVTQFFYKGKTYFCGKFDEEIDAAVAYNLKSIEFFGESALLNRISEDVDEELRIIESFYKKINNPKKQKNTSSKYLGVYQGKSSKRYRSIISIGKTHILVGNFDTELEAATEYNKKALELLGDRAKLNIIL